MKMLRSQGFTIVELTIVIAVIGILTGVMIVGYGAWRQSVADSNVQSDLRSAATAMEDARNYSEGYPLSIPSTVTASKDVTLQFGTGSLQDFCLNGVSVSHPDVKYYISNSSDGPTRGTCADQGLPGSLLASLKLSLEAKKIQQATGTAVNAWSDGYSTHATAVPGSGGAPSFYTSGSDSYVQFTASQSLTVPSLGLSGATPRHEFVRVSSSAQGNIMGTGIEDTGRVFDIWHYTGDKIIWHGYAGGFDNAAVAPVMSMNVWHTVELWYTGTQVGMRLDGGAPFFVTAAVNTGAAPFNIGAGGYSYANTWAGKIKGVYVFNRVLSDAEAATVRSQLESL